MRLFWKMIVVIFLNRSWSVCLVMVKLSVLIMCCWVWVAVMMRWWIGMCVWWVSWSRVLRRMLIMVWFVVLVFIGCGLDSLFNFGFDVFEFDMSVDVVFDMFLILDMFLLLDIVLLLDMVLLLFFMLEVI